ncbi:MAG: YdeI/OmpD-associated family protein [Myxococcota bacterium]
MRGTINGRDFETVLEPDGASGHWMKVDARRKAAGVRAGDSATLVVEPTKGGRSRAVPADLRAALAAAPQAIQDAWKDITPMARWEWVRWVNATKNPETRARRVAVSIAKLESGKRRPCCFDLSACTDPDLAANGKLREPA